MSGALSDEVSGEDAGRDRKSDFEGDKSSYRTGSFKKKAISASSKLRNSFKKKNRRRSGGTDNEDFFIHSSRDADEMQVVDAFRQALNSDHLLPAKYDDYSSLLRSDVVHSLFPEL